MRPELPSREALTSFYLEWWLDFFVARYRATRTLHAYRYDVRHYINPVLGGVRLCDLRTFDIQVFLDELIDGGVAIATARKTRAVLSKSLSDAVGYGILENNPVSQVALPGNVETRSKAMTRDEQNRFVAASEPEDNVGRFMVFALGTGMRMGEMRALRWHNVLADQVIVCEAFLNSVKVGNLRWVAPKGKRRREIPLPEQLRECIEVQRTWVERAAAQAGTRGWRENNLVFPSTRGTPIALQYLAERRHITCERAGIRAVTMHELRHTYATRLIEGGVTLVEVQHLLGHRSINTTASTYVHLTESMRSNAAKVMDSALTTSAKPW